IKIFLTVSHTNLTFWLSIGELLTLILGICFLFLAFRRGVRRSYIIFSVSALLFPTLSGTLSSLPRYILASFAIFIYLGLIKSRLIKITLISIGLCFEALLTILFLQGYFVA